MAVKSGLRAWPKGENHTHAPWVYFMHYNFVRIHQTLCCTSAMEACVREHLWSLEDVVRMLHEWEAANGHDTHE